MSVNLDITFCTNAECPLRSNCVRGQELVSGVHSYARFEPDGNLVCDFYLPIDEGWDGDKHAFTKEFEHGNH